jgi:XTP/dITP diphosphohydrolase
MRIVAATQNQHKLREFRSILKGTVEIISPEDLNLRYRYDESGNTYLENAVGKAEALFDLIKEQDYDEELWVLSDDSGLSVPALDGAPGIYSARYGSEGGKKLEPGERNRYLLNKMEDLQDRSAFYVCCMVLVISSYRVYTVQETWDGEIRKSPKGAGGFGYDPVFLLPEGLTAAEIPGKEKNIRSHRGKAGMGIKLILQNLQRKRMEL